MNEEQTTEQNVSDAGTVRIVQAGSNRKAMIPVMILVVVIAVLVVGFVVLLARGNGEQQAMADVERALVEATELYNDCEQQLALCEEGTEEMDAPNGYFETETFSFEYPSSVVMAFTAGGNGMTESYSFLYPNEDGTFHETGYSVHSQYPMSQLGTDLLTFDELIDVLRGSGPYTSTDMGEVAGRRYVEFISDIDGIDERVSYYIEDVNNEGSVVRLGGWHLTNPHAELVRATFFETLTFTE